MMISVASFLFFPAFVGYNENGVLFGASVMFVLLGAFLCIFPFCTPETVSSLGVKRSVRVGRTISIVMMLAGVTGVLLSA
ncbi:MAG: hypothetical protein LBJ20_04845 [Candidatus Methanoplasma sp.]|jgi:hypothetical protein|nr:hypothetical protein [Candidatus Methanoplasma sp.]